MLRIGFKQRAALLVGDAELVEEGDLLREHPHTLHADVLKLGHHGSRTSTGGDFLAAVAPEMVVICSGVRNRFGHPSPETLSRLRKAGVPWLRTDRSGAVVWQTDGRRVHVKTYATDR